MNAQPTQSEYATIRIYTAHWTVCVKPVLIRNHIKAAFLRRRLPHNVAFQQSALHSADDSLKDIYLQCLLGRVQTEYFCVSNTATHFRLSSFSLSQKMTLLHKHL